jgi:hypothetical protein
MIKLACMGPVGEADCVRDSEGIEEGGKGGLLEPVELRPWSILGRTRQGVLK